MAAINQSERAFRAWPILIAVAENGATITYSELAARLGIHHRAVAHVLGPIQDYCLNEKLPPLTILVVNQTSGKPGPGFVAWDIDDVATGLEVVYGANWRIIENPFLFAADGSTESGLVDLLLQSPDSSADIYAKVKVRGIVQNVFRRLLLDAYEFRCAFCGLSFEEALQAAHIVPWASSTRAQRLDVRNGLLLCSNHHRLFDAGYMTVSESYRIVYYDSECNDGPYSSADKHISIDLHSLKIHLPAKSQHFPLSDFIRQGNKIRGWRRQK